MTIRPMTTADLALTVPLYIKYYNEHEDSAWTEEQAARRIAQMATIQDSCSFILEEDHSVLGFCMGFLRQYDDIISFYLDEIIIADHLQNQGIGTKFMQMIENAVKEKGVSCIELQSVADEMHERFYTKNGFHNAKNFVMKVKWFS